MSIIYFVPSSAAPEGYSPTLYPDGTAKKKGWLTREEYDAQLPVDEVPAPTLEERRAAAVQAVKDASYAAECAGIIVQGVTIPTDRESQTLISGAVVASMLDPATVTQWQTGTDHDGVPVFIRLDAAQMQAIGRTVRAHVQACFDTRAMKFLEIAGLETVESINEWLTYSLNAGWPGQDNNQSEV